MCIQTHLHGIIIFFEMCCKPYEIIMNDVVWDNAPRHEKFYLDLEKLQIDAMRTICGCNNYSSKLLLYIDTNLQPLSIRRKFHRLVLFFKIKKQSLC